MSEWHDSSCRRLDVFTNGGISSCLSCGSVQPGPDPFSPDNEYTHDNIYQTLEHNTDMRLLILKPGGYDDPVCGNLHLTTTSGVFGYDAISYTWAREDGHMERSGHIMLNSQSFAVTPSCEAALRRARSRSGPKAIWIDAICINQEDLRERGHQVRLMQQIYSRAECVLIYIGEPSQEEDELLAFISCQDESLIIDRDLLPQLRIALFQLFQRRYFSRIWVLQEVALARRAILICGKHSIPWSLMETQRLGRIRLLKYREVPGYPPTLSFFFFEGLEGLPPVLNFRAPAFRDPSELLQLLETTRESRASDPRDKVFALLGLLTCPESDGLVADYTKSTAEIYTSIAIWIAQRFGLPALLSRTCIIPGKPNIEYQIPHWVPYWASDDFQQLKSGLGGRRLVDLDEEPTVTLAGRLPVTVCERDVTAIKFPALLLGTAAQVLERHQNHNGYSVFDFISRPDDHSIIGTTESSVPGPDFNLIHPMSRLVDKPSQYIHLNYPINKKETDEGKTCEHNSPQFSVTAEDSLGIHTWTEDLIYLIPEPRDDGFQFTKPGFVSVSDNLVRRLKNWTHTNEQGEMTTGRFSDYAICCSEHREGGTTRVYLRGLLNHRWTPCPGLVSLVTRKFEFVSAR